MKWISSQRQYANGLMKEGTRQLLTNRLRHEIIKFTWDPLYIAAKKKLSDRVNSRDEFAQASTSTSTLISPTPSTKTRRRKRHRLRDCGNLRCAREVSALRLCEVCAADRFLPPFNYTFANRFTLEEEVNECAEMEFDLEIIEQQVQNAIRPTSFTSHFWTFFCKLQHEPPPCPIK